MSNWTLKNPERKQKGGIKLPPVKRSSGKQIFLTLLLCGIVLSTFMMVFAVDYYYTNLDGTSDEQVLFTTDSNTDYLEYDYKTGTSLMDSWRTAQYMYVPVGHHYQYNRTPAYLGNDTWSANVNNTDALLPYGWNYFAVVITLTEVPTWILSKIVVNVTLNGDTDLRVASSIDHFNDEADPSDPLGANLLFHDASAGGMVNYNKSFPISLTTALAIFDTSQERTDYTLALIVYDKNADGLSAWASKWKIELHGSIVTGWSEQTTIALVLLAGTSFNLIGGWFALDQNDWGKDIKDIPPKRKPKSTTPKSKRRRK